MFFFYAAKVKQPGNVTRIVSACTTQQQAELTDFFEAYIRPLNPEKFHMHFTPDYGDIKRANGKYYKYMNKRKYMNDETRRTWRFFQPTGCPHTVDFVCSLWTSALDGTLASNGS